MATTITKRLQRNAPAVAVDAHRCEVDAAAEECWYCGAPAGDVRRFGYAALSIPEIPQIERDRMNEDVNDD